MKNDTTPLSVQAVLNRTANRKQDQAERAAENELDYRFFKVKKDAEGNFKDVQILQVGFLDLLRRLGFRRFDTGADFIIVRIQDNIIEEIYPHRLRELIVRHFMALDEDALLDFGCPKDYLLEKLHRSLATLTTPEKMSLLVDVNRAEMKIEMVEDDKEHARFFYQNGWVEVTAKGIALKPYKSLPGFIWKDQILPRDFKAVKAAEMEKGNYYKFACNVSGNPSLAMGEKANDPDRFGAFSTITGYCLHRYFQSKLKTVVFLDARISEDPDGRSGKSLHTKAMRAMLNADEVNSKQCVICDGKEFNPENRFKYDDLHVSTKLFILDDVKRGLPIEMFFNAIVDGFQREIKGEKNKHKIFCKLILTLNYTLQIRGGSARDRVVEFEFADHYSADHTPETEFKQWFFRDWDVQEWNLFDNFMLSCVLDYLQHGIIMPSMINLEARKLRDETNQEFINFMEDLAIEHERAYDKKELYNKFLEIGENGEIGNRDMRWLKRKMFAFWLRWWGQYRPEIAGIKEHRSSGKDFIRFFYNEPATAENIEGATLFKGKSSKCIAKAPKLSDEPPY